MDSNQTPTAICNQALDEAGIDMFLGDIEEGTRPAQVCLRHYTEGVRQLLRAVHWDFARREVPLLMVADASGQTPNVGRFVPSGFLYAYGYPPNCAKLRFIPANYLGQRAPVPQNNIQPPNPDSPLTSAPLTNPIVMPIMPSRFLITSDMNYVEQGASNDIPGSSPVGRTLILSNVCEARAVYTFEAFYPNLWDALFRQAMVALLASKLAMPLAKDKKFGLVMRDKNISIAQTTINQAMVTNGNESWANSDISVDWMRFRSSGGWAGNWGNNWGVGPGYLFGGLDAIGWGVGNTSAY